MFQSLAQHLSEVFQTAPLAYPEKSLGSKIHRTKYITRALALGTATRKWFDLLRNPKFAPLVQRHPRLYCKLQWPYLAKSFPIKKKLQFLEHHYAFLDHTFSKLDVERLSSDSGLHLASIDIPEAGQFALILRAGRCEKEGELTLTLCEPHPDIQIYSLTFSVTHWKGQNRQLMIGGIQGHHFPDEKSRTVEITRGMFGLRPKALVLLALQHLSSIWKIQRICAVNNEQHIYRSFRKRRKIYADYDAFWLESGGTKTAKGLFEIPLTTPPKNLEDVKPNKRSMYRKRYVMLAKLEDEIRGQLAPNGAFIAPSLILRNCHERSNIRSQSGSLFSPALSKM